MEVVKFTQESFDAAMSDERPVLVDFFATWCGPCKMMSPVVDKFAAAHPDITVGKIDVDECGEVAARFGIMSIPTVIVFKNGKEVARHTGTLPQASLEALVEKALL